MTIWYVGAAASLAIAVAGLVFIAKGWGSQSGEASVKNLFTAKGSAAFLVFALGFAGAGYCLYSIGENQRQEEERRAVVAQVDEIRGAATLDEMVAAAPRGQSREETYGRWLMQLFEEARVSVGVGSQDGVTEGAYLAAIPAGADLDGLRSDELGAVNSDAAALLRVVAVRADRSVAQLESFAIDAFVERLEEDPGATPVGKGQSVVLVPGAERDAWDRIDEQGAAASGEGSAAREANLQLLRLGDAFLLEHADGWFAPDVLFRRGDAQRALGRPREARWTFELFVRRFPFHPSADGARERLEELGAGRDLN